LQRLQCVIIYRGRTLATDLELQLMTLLTLNKPDARYTLVKHRRMQGVLAARLLPLTPLLHAYTENAENVSSWMHALDACRDAVADQSKSKHKINENI